jgi:hypothetical protein
MHITPVGGNVFADVRFPALAGIQPPPRAFHIPAGGMWRSACSKRSNNMNQNQANQRIVTVFVDSFAENEYGDGPSFAKIEVDDAFIERLRKLQSICEQYNFSEVRVYASPEMWGPNGIEDELRLQCAELVVSMRSFYFTNYPKYGNYAIMSRGLDIDQFCREVQAAEGVLYLGTDDTNDLKNRVEKDAVLPIHS